MSLNIFLLVNDCSFRKVTASSNDKIEKLKKYVQEEFNTSKVIKLKYKGKILNPVNILKDYDISDYSVIQVVKSNRIIMVKKRHETFKKAVLVTKVLLRLNPNCFESIMTAIEKINPLISHLICKKENYFIEQITKPLLKKDLKKVFKKTNSFNSCNLKKMKDNSKNKIFNHNSSNNKLSRSDKSLCGKELYTPIFEEFIAKIQRDTAIQEDYKITTSTNNNQIAYQDNNFYINQDDKNLIVSNDLIDDFFKRNQVCFESLFNFNNNSKFVDFRSEVLDKNHSYYDFENL